MPTLPDLTPLAARADNRTVRVLMVCMGNICRSPTAHGVLQKKVLDAHAQKALEVDSAGTHGYHIGNPPDARAQQHALRRGYDLSTQRARQLMREDFERFDLILTMDAANETLARRLAPAQPRAQLMRLTDFCTHHQASEVPDPYYGGEHGFEAVLDLVEDACQGLLAALRLT